MGWLSTLALLLASHPITAFRYRRLSKAKGPAKETQADMGLWGQLLVHWGAKYARKYDVLSGEKKKRRQVRASKAKSFEKAKYLPCLQSTIAVLP